MWLEIWEKEVPGLALLHETLLMQGTHTKKLHIGEDKERMGWTSPKSKTALKCVGPTSETKHRHLATWPPLISFLSNFGEK